MKKWIFLIILFLIVGGGVWFWSLGSLPSDETPRIVLSEATGEVLRKSGADDPFAPVGAGAELVVGDVIKTGASAMATVDFFGDSQTRLDENTELTVSAAAPESEGVGIHLKLEVGRVWSRVMRVLDLDAAFSIETNDVVATVRGTAFDVEKRPNELTTLWVSESVVEAEGKGSALGSVFVPEGAMADFVPGRRTTSTRAISAKGLASKWFKQNRESDRRFSAKATERFKNSLGVDRVPSQGVLRELARSSEALRERVGNLKQREMQKMKILVRRLAEMRESIEQGNVGAASDDLARFANEWKSRFETADERQKKLARGSLAMGLRLYADVHPGQEGYRLKQEIETLLLSTATTPREKAHARLLTIDARLDEAAMLIFDLGDTASGRDAAKAALQAVENAEREFAGQELRPLQAFRVRAENLLAAEGAPVGEPVAPDELAPASAPSDSDSPTPKTSTPTPPPPSTAPTVPTTDLLACSGVRLSMQPNPVNVGQQAVLSARALFPDGHEEDATSNATYALFGNIGTLQKNLFTASAPGSARAEASLACQSGTVRSSLEVRVFEAVVIRTLTLAPSIAKIQPLQSVNFRATVTYSSGVTKDVTASTQYALTNSQLGSLAGPVFTAGRVDGTLRVTATYVENGVTVNGAADIEIASQQQSPTAP